MPEPSIQRIDLMEYHAFFAPYRMDSPGAEAICALIEVKVLELIKQVNIMVVPQPGN